MRKLKSLHLSPKFANSAATSISLKLNSVGIYRASYTLIVKFPSTNLTQKSKIVHSL